MTKWIAGILGTVIGGLLLAYALNLFGPQKDGKDGGGGPPPPPPIEKVVMGPLELGINRQGDDFDAFGKPAANEQLCAEMCRADDNCDAMTYVKSTGVCWLKNGVPPTSANADMVSSVKKRSSADGAM